jgi:uncharacterized protein YgbK (DUF1537 family)
MPDPEHPRRSHDVVAEDAVLGRLPPVRRVPPSEVAEALEASRRRLVVLDDDPTGTQTVAGVPVLTTWRTADLCWGLRQDAPALYVLTNTRSLDPPEAEARNREVVEALVEASDSEQIPFVIASRGDSTLRGHFPLETDALGDALAQRAGVDVDGVVVVPAYIDSGRLTVDSVHWLRVPGGLLPVGNSEFAKDATFAYHSSDLRDYVEEKTNRRWAAATMARITVWDLREHGVEAVASVLQSLTGGAPVVVDAVCDDDLRVLSLALDRAERAGKTFLYRVGPSFVRARAGLEVQPPLTTADVDAIRRAAPGRPSAPASPHGLVVVGSHVAQTTRQLEAARRLDGIEEIEVDVWALLDPARRQAVVGSATRAALSCIVGSEVLVTTSRAVVTGADAATSLSIARTVSGALVEIVRRVVDHTTPSWLVAKGGITASDVATAGLGIGRAWARGTLLPGIVSVWEPVSGTAPGLPFVVFAGNVGDDDALRSVVTILRGPS